MLVHNTHTVTQRQFYLYSPSSRPACIRQVPPAGRPSHTWLRAIEADLGPLNFGLATAWRKATTRDEWRHIVDTATLQRSTLWKKEEEQDTAGFTVRQATVTATGDEFCGCGYDDVSTPGRKKNKKSDESVSLAAVFHCARETGLKAGCRHGRFRPSQHSQRRHCRSKTRPDVTPNNNTNNITAN